ncbi:hypothetical protein [Flavobacterium album]|uniref:hypothetical protein n=1 Tax=Flavobacterium album TaxID=2175091 RepID=UPI0015E7F3A1|nr:hypothetical protein [Flavobacterium album]
MKKFILTIALIATLGATTVSCSTDDSALTDTSADSLGQQLPGNGDVGLPKPTTPKP